MDVRAIYDSVASRAENAAATLGATPVQGVLSLLDRTDVKAILLLDSAWLGHEMLQLLCSQQKPIFIADSLDVDAGKLTQLHNRAVANGLTLMPEFGRRYTPATSRLQELMATRIGRPRHLVIEATTCPEKKVSGTFSSYFLSSRHLAHFIFGHDFR